MEKRKRKRLNTPKWQLTQEPKTEKIMKIIELTDIDNTTLLVNIESIEAVYIDEDGDTTIVTINDNKYCCNETPKEVYQKIKEIEND